MEVNGDSSSDPLVGTYRFINFLGYIWNLYVLVVLIHSRAEGYSCVIDIFIRFLENNTGCVEFGCSYVKTGSPPDEVYCFKPGSYAVHVADECPLEATGECNLLN